MSKNILLIVIDQLRADLINGALASHVNLPNIRALQSEAVTFSNHYTVTSPCGPSRASLLTGLYAMNHRSIRNGSPLDATLPTIGTEMRKVGYEPLLFGYTDTSPDPRNRHPDDPDLTSYEGLLPGFAEIVRMRLESNTSWFADLKSKGYSLPEADRDMFAAVSPNGGKAQINDPTVYSAADSDTAFLTDQTIKELSVRTRKDWFALLTYIRPHPPFAAPAPYNTMYDPGLVPPPRRPQGSNAFKQAHPLFAAEFSDPSNKYLYIGHDGFADRLTDEQVQQLRAVYLGLTSEVDAHVGRLITFLKDSGQYDDTLIVVTADHGEGLGDHNIWGKHMPFESSFHIPLIIRDPHNNSNAGNFIELPTESIDITPTILDWAGGKLVSGFNGRSLLPTLDGTLSEGWRDHIFSEVDLGDAVSPSRFQAALGLEENECNYAVLWKGQYKLIHFNGGLPPLLYDLRADPDESENLAESPDHQQIMHTLMAAMLDHRMTHANHTLSHMKITGSGVQTAI